MVGWWVRNTGNKAQLRPALAGALPELGNEPPPITLGGGWVRNTENKAQLRPAGAGALPELGRNITTSFACEC